MRCPMCNADVQLWRVDINYNPNMSQHDAYLAFRFFGIFSSFEAAVRGAEKELERKYPGNWLKNAIGQLVFKTGGWGDVVRGWVEPQGVLEWLEEWARKENR